MEKIHTTCIYCGCGCGLFLHVEGDRVVGASPSPGHPLSRGRLCIKGWLAGEFVGHPDRLRYPLIKRDDRQVRATWDEALSLVAGLFTEVKETYGRDSLAVLTSAKGTDEENFMLMKLARAVLKTNNVDHVARLCHAPTLAALSYALGSGSMTNPIDSLLKSEAILVVGSNTTEQHPMVAANILEAQSKGADLLVFDPRRTQIADLADIHLTPAPGTDVAWINGLLNVIIDEGLTDEKFIRDRTQGFEQVKEAASCYTPEVVESISGIPSGQLKEAALSYGAAEAASIVYAMGITQHTAGTDNVQALANLALATGNLGREGTGIYPLRGHQNVQGACDMGALPDLLPGYSKVSDPRRFEEAWSVDLPREPGLTAVEILEAAKEGSIKAIYISGENPLMSYPDRDWVSKALKALDLLVVADIFPTETTRLAHVVLPVASFAEKDGTFTSTERRVQLISKAVSPPGEALSELEVIFQLMERLGAPYRSLSPAEVMEEIASLNPHYGGIRYRRLGIDGLQWPCPDEDHPGTGILHREAFPIGRARFRPVFQKELHESPDEDYPFLLITGRTLYHFHSGSMTRRTSLLDREVPGPVVDVNPDDAKHLGIRNRQRVVLESRRGRLEVEARIDPGLMPGILYLPFHFSEAPANALTARALDPASKIPAFKISAVSMRRA